MEYKEVEQLKEKIKELDSSYFLNELESLKSSLKEIIVIMKPTWCAKATGLSKSAFTDFKNGHKKNGKWKAEKMIKIYEQLYAALTKC